MISPSQVGYGTPHCRQYHAPIQLATGPLRQDRYHLLSSPTSIFTSNSSVSSLSPSASSTAVASSFVSTSFAVVALSASPTAVASSFVSTSFAVVALSASPTVVVSPPSIITPPESVWSSCCRCHYSSATCPTGDFGSVITSTVSPTLSVTT